MFKIELVPKNVENSKWNADCETAARPLSSGYISLRSWKRWSAELRLCRISCLCQHCREMSIRQVSDCTLLQQTSGYSIIIYSYISSTGRLWGSRWRLSCMFEGASAASCRVSGVSSFAARQKSQLIWAVDPTSHRSRSHLSKHAASALCLNPIFISQPVFAERFLKLISSTIIRDAPLLWQLPSYTSFLSSFVIQEIFIHSGGSQNVFIANLHLTFT